MTLKVADRVRENTSSTGVGGLSLTGSPVGFQRFNVFLASGDITYYTLEENDKWEVGVGTYGSNNLERTTILSSSNSGSKISLGGSGVVFVTYPAEKAIFNSETNQLVLGASGLLFSNGTNLKEAKLVELTDVNLSGTPTQNSVFDLNITNKSLSIGDKTGPTNSNNILIGYGAGSGITSGSDSVIIGSESSTINKTGQHNVHIGAKAGPTVSDAASAVYSSVAVGYSAGNKMRHQSIAIGYEAALHAYEIGFVGIGYQVGSGLGGYSTIIGYQAGRTLGEDYAIAIGYQAGYNGAGESAVWIGQGAGHSSTGSTKSIGIGKNAGKSSSGTECIYIGESAGLSNSTSNLLFIGNGSPAANDTLIKGDMDSKRVAIGVADVTLSDTLFVGVNAANDEGLVVKGAASQVSNLTSWKNSSDGVLASVDNNGIISGHGIYATGNGIQIANTTPSVTTNKLYNAAGTLYFNGSQLASAGASAEASYASGQAIANEGDIVAVSGIAAYASGVGGGGGDVTTAQLNYVSGIAVYGSGVLTGGNPTFDNVDVKEYIKHDGDTNTYIRFRADQLDFVAGNVTMITLDEASNDKVIINTGGNDIDFQVEGQNDGNLIRTDAANDLVGIGTSSPSYKVDIFGHDAWMRASGVIVGNSGVVLANNAPAVTTNTLYNDGGTLKFNGSTVGDVTTAQLVYVSGVAVYGSGQVQSLGYASGVAAYSSGVLTGGIPTFDDMYVGEYIYRTGEADTYIRFRDDQFDFVVGGLKMLTLDEATDDKVVVNEGGNNVDFRVESNNEQNLLFTDGDNDKVGIGTNAPAYRLDVVGHDAWMQASGIIVGNSGVVLANNSPAVTTNTLYNDGGTLKFNGSTVGGGDVTTAQLSYVSGIAVYSSGQTIENQGNITALNTASGIATSLLAVSGTATSLVASSGIATYASGQAIENEGLATYASGQAISNQGNITALNTASGIATSLLAVSGTVTSLVATSGIASYASGNTANITFGSNAEGDILYHNGTSFSRLAKGTNNYILKMDGNVPNWEAESSGGGVSTADLNYVSGIAVYSSGQTISNQSNITALNTASGIATSLLAVSGTATSLVASSGIATYASGQAIANESDIVATSGIANYASGQAISNQGNITALNTASGIATSLLTVSGTATSLVATSGIATYASGVLTGGTPTFDDVYVKEYIKHDGDTDTYIRLRSDQLDFVAGNTTFLTLDETSQDIAVVNTGGNDIDFKVQGEGDTNLFRTDAENDRVGIGTSSPSYKVDIFGHDAWMRASGVIIGNSGVVLANNAPAVTTNTLYNDGGTLKFNGSTVGGGDVTTAQLSYVSGIAVYSSGQAISNQSNITALNTASGIATSLLAVSGTATSLVASSGIATYASGQAIANEGDILALNTASGIATSLLTVSGVATSLIATSGTTTALIATSGTATALINSSGIATYASGQVNVTTAGTAVASKALVLDSAKSFTGTKHGVFSQFDSRVTASGVTIGASGITLTGGAYVQEAVPANDTPATEDATITLDLNTGNYHNVILGVNVTKFEFINSKRGQRFLLRITQHAGSAKTVAWTNVDYTTGGAAAAVRWAGGGTAPTMSTATSHTDVYGFLCTNNAGSAFDGFVVGQNLPD